MTTQQFESWKQPEGASLEDWLNTRIARFETRKYDFEALKFQADYDPKYRRAQMRYMGTVQLVLQMTATLYLQRTLRFRLWCYHHSVKVLCIFTTTLKKFSLCSAAKLICLLSTTERNSRPV